MKKKLAEYSLIVLTPLLFLGTLEILLWMLNVQPLLKLNDPFVGFAGTTPLYEKYIDGDSAYWKTADNKKRWFNEQTFFYHKPDSAFRIFTLGGSTTYGRPYRDKTSFTGWLRAYLQAADSSKVWEVVNSGGISYASYRLANLAEELTAYHPDLLVIYTGHNEFLEERTYRKLRSLSPWFAQMAKWFGHLRTYSWFKQMYQSLSFSKKENLQNKQGILTAEVSTRLENSVGPKDYVRNDSLTAQVIEHFSFSLDRILQIAKRRDIPVILITPLSNLKDCNPFKSQLEHSGNASLVEEWFQKAKIQEQQHQDSVAESLYLKILKKEPRYAKVHYRLGKIYIRHREYTKAKYHLKQAKEQDVCPLRALDTLYSLVVEKGIQNKKDNVYLINFQTILENRSQQEQGHKILGKEYFLDHVHPTIKTHQILGHELFLKLQDLGIVVLGPHWNSQQRQQVEESVWESVDSLENSLALHNLAKVLNWAGKFDEATNIATQALAMDTSHSEAYFSSLIVGTALEREGKSHQAVPHYRRAVQIDSNNLNARKLLADALMRAGKRQEAYKEYQGMLFYLRNELGLLRQLAVLAIEFQDWRNLLAYASHGLLLKSNDLSLEYQVGKAKLNLEDWEGARLSFVRVLQGAPSHAWSHFGLGKIEEVKGNVRQAIQYYSTALKLKPNLLEARKSLQRLLNSSN